MTLAVLRIFCFYFLSSNFCRCEIQLYTGRVLGVRRSALHESQRTFFSLSLSVIFSFSFPPFV